MYGLTRGAITLVGVIVAGVLIWLGVDPLSGESIGRGEFWWAVLMCALAGLVMALSQVLGGWTKWGWPRLSLNVFLFAFLPALIAGGGSFCTPSRETGSWAETCATGRTISESTEWSEIWQSPRSRSHSASGLCSASHSTPPALGSAGGPSLSPRSRRQRLHRRTKTTVACGSTRAAQRRARAIPTASC